MIYTRDMTLIQPGIFFSSLLHGVVFAENHPEKKRSDFFSPCEPGVNYESQGGRRKAKGEERKDSSEKCCAEEDNGTSQRHRKIIDIHFECAERAPQCVKHKDTRKKGRRKVE